MTPGLTPEAQTSQTSRVAGGHPAPARPGAFAVFAAGRGPWLALVAAALAVRAAFAFYLPDRLMWPDPIEFEAVGRTLYEKGTYGLHTLRPPGYPTLIAGVYKLFGPHLLPLRLVEALLATVAVGVIGSLGIRLFGRRAGLIAMTLAAFHPMLAFLPATQYSESTSTLLTTLVLAASFWALERGGAWRWALGGVLLGLLTLVRPNAIAMLPGLGLGFVLLLHRQKRGWIVPVLVTGLAFALSLMPWTVRNYIVHHHWFYISTGGGRQLWLGNNPYSTSITTEPVIIDEKTEAELQRLPDVFQDDRYLYSQAIEFIRTHPARATRLYLIKLGNIFALHPETLTRTYVNPASRISQGIATVLIFAGCLLALPRWKSEPALWPIAGTMLTFVLATAFAFSSVRYRMTVEPCLILIAGLGWSRLWPGAPKGMATNGSNLPPRTAA